MAKMVVVTLCLLCLCLTPTLSAPARTYDQRQQGDLNIHAQLDNIVVVVIPSARLNLLELASDMKFPGEKGGFLQLLQKLQNAEVDRYETVKEGEDSQAEATGEYEIDIKKPIPVITSSQHVTLTHEDKNGEKEEEVVATVEEMKPDPTEKITEPPRSEATEDSPVKEQSTVGEVVQDSVLTVSVPEELKDAVKEAEKKIKEFSHSENDSKNQQKFQHEVDVKSSNELKKESRPENGKEKQQTLQHEVNIKKGNGLENDTVEKLKSSGKGSPNPLEMEDNYKPEVTVTEPPKDDGPTIEDYIKPVAAKEEIIPSSNASTNPLTTEDASVSVPKKSIEPVRLQEGVRKEKVIRYKPEAKWAPELVDLLGPPRPKPKELQERQMFADLCSPGAWDPELRTCIMPGETRSRGELARFLDAMRFGISIPK